MTGALAIGILAVSVAAGAWSAAKLAGSKPMVICLLVGGGDLLMLFAATAFFFGGKYQGIPVTAALVLGTCAVAGIAGAGVGRGTSGFPRNTGSVNLYKTRRMVISNYLKYRFCRTPCKIYIWEIVWLHAAISGLFLHTVVSKFASASKVDITAIYIKNVHNLQKLYFGE